MIKKFYRNFVFITDILLYLIFSYAMLTEWYKIGMSSKSSIPWLLLGLLFFIISIRKILKKPSLGELLKQFRNRYKS